MCKYSQKWSPILLVVSFVCFLLCWYIARVYRFCTMSQNIKYLQLIYCIWSFQHSPQCLQEVDNVFLQNMNRKANTVLWRWPKFKRLILTQLIIATMLINCNTSLLSTKGIERSCRNKCLASETRLHPSSFEASKHSKYDHSLVFVCVSSYQVPVADYSFPKVFRCSWGLNW